MPVVLVAEGIVAPACSGNKGERARRDGKSDRAEWRSRQDLNLRPPVKETGALSI